MSPEQEMTFYLLSIRGKLRPATVEAARGLHNSTAGTPQNVAAARSLGDVSHMVYVPTEHKGPAAGEFLILDVWNSLDGLNQFFGIPQVQEQAGQIFTERDPVVWAPAQGFLSYHLPTPYGKNDRSVGIVRGAVASVEQARAVHNEFVGGQMNKARIAGNVSHDSYFRLAAPGSPEALEYFAVDVWMDLASMGAHYADPSFGAAFQKLFTGAPSATSWQHPAGEWVEW